MKRHELRRMVEEFLLGQRSYRTLCYLWDDDAGNYRKMWDACQDATGKGPFDWYPPKGSSDLVHAKPFIQWATQYLWREHPKKTLEDVYKKEIAVL